MIDSRFSVCLAFLSWLASGTISNLVALADNPPIYGGRCVNQRREKGSSCYMTQQFMVSSGSGSSFLMLDATRYSILDSNNQDSISNTNSSPNLPNSPTIFDLAKVCPEPLIATGVGNVQQEKFTLESASEFLPIVCLQEDEIFCPHASSVISAMLSDLTGGEQSTEVLVTVSHAASKVESGRTQSERLHYLGADMLQSIETTYFSQSSDSFSSKNLEPYSRGSWQRVRVWYPSNVRQIPHLQVVHLRKAGGAFPVTVHSVQFCTRLDYAASKQLRSEELGHASSADYAASKQLRSEASGHASSADYADLPNLPAPELDALESIYNSAGGPNWHYSHFLNSQVPWNFTAAAVPFPCEEEWAGITCSCELSDCHVTKLSLFLANMTGLLSPSVGNLSQLEVLDLNHNHLTGRIPSSVADLSLLKTLDLDANEFTGPLPSGLFAANATLLETLRLANNLLTGTIPSDISNLAPTLLTLDMAGNNFTGSIPIEMSLLFNLQQIQLTENLLTGPIPPELGQLRNLSYLSLGNNRLNGSLSQSYFQNLSNLRVLNLDGNLLTGEIPFSLGSCRELNFMFVSRNRLSGGIPDWFSANSSLISFYVDQNRLTGSIPTDIGSMRHLVFIDLSHNYLTGTVPESFSNLSSLYFLNAGSNSLSGTIPSGILSIRTINTLEMYDNLLSGPVPLQEFDSNRLLLLDLHHNFLTGTIPAAELATVNRTLTGLDLHGNQLTGTLPSALGNIIRLNFLRLQSNALSGSIPKSLGQLTSLAELQLEKNDLTGSIPSSLGDMKVLYSLSLNENRLQGTIPVELSQIHTLSILFIQKNRLHGNLNGLVDTSLEGTSLANIDVSGNELTGTIPTEIFNLSPLLASFAASTNCFHGSLPEQICEASSLTSLVLNGLSTASHCKQKLFPAFGIDEAFTLQHNIADGVPECLMVMPNLETLHLSGNGLDGTIPGNIDPASPLSDLILSHNLLTGTIPASIQTRKWKNLDLSYNKLGGKLSSDFAHYNSDASLTLEVNRLSGSIPDSLHSVKNISILTANLFNCEQHIADSNSNLPQHDKNTDTYSCGSDTVNHLLLSMVAFLGLCSITITLLLCSMRDEASQLAENIKVVAACRKIACSVSECMQEFFSTPTRRTSKNSVRHSNIPLLGIIFNSFRLIITLLGGLLISVLMPLFYLLSQYFQVYEEKYAWTFSPTYLSGKRASYALMAILCTFMLFSFYLIQVLVADLVRSWRSEGDASGGVADRSGASEGDTSRGVADGGVASGGDTSGGVADGGLASEGDTSRGVADGGVASEGDASGGVADGGVPIGSVANGGELEKRRQDIHLKQRSSAGKECSSRVIEHQFSVPCEHQSQHSQSQANTVRSSCDSGLDSSNRAAAVSSVNNVERPERDCYDDAVASLNRPSSGRFTVRSGSQGISMRHTGGVTASWFSDSMSMIRRSIRPHVAVASGSAAVREYGLSAPQLAIFCGVGLVNCITMLSLDVLYIIVTFRGTVAEVAVVQLILALIKIYWNDLALRSMLTRTRRWYFGYQASTRESKTRFVAASDSVQPSSLPFSFHRTSTVTSSSANPDSDSGFENLAFSAKLDTDQTDTAAAVAAASSTSGTSTVMASVMLSKQRRMYEAYESYDISFVIFTCLLNNIIFPLLAVMVVSSDCLYNAFISASSVDSSYSYTTCKVIRVVAGSFINYRCVEFGQVEETSSYKPPFLYSYQCASDFLRRYVVLYGIMFVLIGFFLPLVKAISRYLLSQCTPGSIMYRLILSILPPNHKPLAPRLLSTEPLPVFFEKRRFLVRLMSLLSVLLTFGTLFPPLGVLFCAALYSFVFYEQFALGRVLHEARNQRITYVRRIVENESSGVARPIMQAFIAGGILSCAIFAFFVFDTLGDKVGWENALWALIFTAFVPVMVRKCAVVASQRLDCSQGSALLLLLDPTLVKKFLPSLVLWSTNDTVSSGMKDEEVGMGGNGADRLHDSARRRQTSAAQSSSGTWVAGGEGGGGGGGEEEEGLP